ncbi:polyphosphate kinase 1 [Ekhidna sp.]|jgi:polyphosphate kinase|uniref:polyphosphate kinase 1 n=1 Tax=Ekhidna sp. TaxID=2608089 RepID=UPI0032EF681F
MQNTQNLISKSDLISRDLSWLQFNHRVLDQARKEKRNLFEKLKFLAITSSNADEFNMIRVGSLYNYLDYGNDRIDYSGLRAIPFKNELLAGLKEFGKQQNQLFLDLKPSFRKHNFEIKGYDELTDKQKKSASKYFEKTIFPMLTPMVFDPYHSFPILMNNILIFGVVTKALRSREKKKMSFIQLPQNLPRFFEINEKDKVTFVPIERIVQQHFDRLFKNVDIISSSLFRVTRNGDFTLEESEDIEANFLEEMKKKLKTRKTGRVVRMEVEEGGDPWLIKQLKKRYEIGSENIKITPEGSLIDFTCLWQIVNHEEFKSFLPIRPKPVPPVSMTDVEHQDMFKILKDRDILLHHPYNTIEPLLDLLEQAADDPHVLSIKLTIYRLAKDSRVVEALLQAAENGKHVSVLFEVKARFDEENNMKQAQRLQKAGCFVIYGVGSLKTHTKLLLIVRKEKEKVNRFVHMSSGNYNEATSKLYTDMSLLSSDESYANDVQEFFNVITGHSMPEEYDNLITAPTQMRKDLIKLINKERENAKAGIPSGIVIKLNSLQDKDAIMALYEASKAGVPIKLIVRGICCLRPGREGLSENITVRSIVGEYLEHSRIFYFHNGGDPKVYCGSADMMVRSFDRRLESLFIIKDPLLKQQAINILAYNLKDNVNSYEMKEDGEYVHLEPNGESPFDIHQEFYKVKREVIMKAKLFG